MKRFWMIFFKTVALLVFIPILMGAIAGLITGQSIIVFIVLFVISVIPCFFIIRSFYKHPDKKIKQPIKQKENETHQTVMQIPLGDESNIKIVSEFREVTEEYKDETISSPKTDFDKYSIALKTKQLLETLDILELSPNPDTVASRYSYLLDVLKDVEKFRTNKKFIDGTQRGIGYYQKENEKFPKQAHITLLMDTVIDYSGLNNYFKECIINSCLRHFQRQSDYIAKLKNQKPKNNRIDKLGVLHEYTLGELKKYGLRDDENILQKALDDIRDKWYKDI